MKKIKHLVDMILIFHKMKYWKPTISSVYELDTFTPGNKTTMRPNGSQSLLTEIASIS